MSDVEKIKEFALTPNRNKIVIGNHCVPTLRYIDVGQALSKILADESYTSNCEKCFRQIMINGGEDCEIGKYVAIENIGILFEPELKLNIETLFEDYSRGQCLILCSEGEIIGDDFHFFLPNSGYKFNLRKLSYIRI